MTLRQQELQHFADSLQWLSAAEAATVYSLAIRYSSDQFYGPSPGTVSNIRRYRVTADAESAAPWLAEAVGKGRVTVVFGRSDVLRTSGEFLVREWPNLFCPSRDDVIILPEVGNTIVFYHHEDVFEVGRIIDAI